METKNTTHTEGPWEQEIAAKTLGRFRAKGTCIVNQHGTVGRLVGFSVEDRRLIAAAPEILSALKKIEFRLRASVTINANQVRDELVKIALEAIAKAEGK